MGTAASIRSRLIAEFPDAEVEVEDLTGTDDHFQAQVMTSQFRGKTLLEQHRMVYAALGDLVNGPIHALALHTRTAPGLALVAGPAADATPVSPAARATFPSNGGSDRG
ncbi:MAG: BolA family transcriptional regulator [Polyangiaceae bacterium]|jgi:stress-induced morphogen